MDLIRTAEAARILGVHPVTVTRWIAAGQLEPAFTAPGYRGLFLFERDAIEELAHERSLQAAS